jgi:hypothetical protein
MPDPSLFLQTLSTQLDAIEAALLQQEPASVSLACQQLQQLLVERSRQPGEENWSSPENRIAAAAIDQRMKSVRTTLLQQGAAAGRALATLLPAKALDSYGGKAAFGTATRGPNTRFYQA